MSKIREAFSAKPAFIGFFTGGDGGIDYSVETALALVEGGVDILEIGMPFSDPVADGPVIQASSQRALDGGSTQETLLEIARGIRKKSEVPLLFFSYYNPLLQAGRSYLNEMKKAGFDAVLVVDLPFEEGAVFFDAVKDAGMGSIFVSAPSTSTNRLKSIAERSEDFIYYACQKGTTGIRKNLPEDFGSKIGGIKKVTKVPVAAGFGISDRESARAALQFADGFVVGSAFVKLMEKRADADQIKRLAQQIDPR